MAIYMKVPYATGSVTAAKYKNWIDLDSLDLGVERAISMETGSLKARASGVPKFTLFTVRKETEDASPGILSELLHGVSGQKVEIAVVEAGDQPKEIVKYTLMDALVAAYSVSASGETPYESLSFAYSEIEMAFTPRDTANSGAAPTRVSYSLEKGS